ncbi:MAG: TerC family protein [Myxococcota bacterium]
MLETVASPGMWVGFAALVLVTLAIDLGLFNRKAHEPTFREALAWSGVWVSLAMAFCSWLWLESPQRGMEFLTGYVVEYALSVDNVFIFLVIFSTFAVPRAYQHRVLFWGVLGAVGLRAAMIFGGTLLLARFHWLIYVFGAFLIATGAKMLAQRDVEPHPERSFAFRLLRRIVPTTSSYHGDAFVVVEHGRRVATPLFLVLVLVELTDVVFALDSIPAIFAVTNDPFVVLTSNVFAILGLRSLFFVLGTVIHRFAYLKVGLALTLVFIGAKMAAAEVVKVPIAVSLAVIATLIGGSIAYSAWRTRSIVARSADAGPETVDT